MSDFESERGVGTDWFAAVSEELGLTTDAAIEASLRAREAAFAAAPVVLSQAPTGDAYGFMEAHRAGAVEPPSARDEAAHRAIRASDATS